MRDQGGRRGSSLGRGCFSTGSVPLPQGVLWGGKGFPRGRFLRQEKFHSQGQCQQPVGQEEMPAHKTVGATPLLGDQAHPPPIQYRKRWLLGTLQSVGVPTGGRHTQDRCLAQKDFPLTCVILYHVCWNTGIDWLASPESKAKRGFSINLLLSDPPRPRQFGSTEHWVLEWSFSWDDSLGTKAWLDF